MGTTGEPAGGALPHRMKFLPGRMHWKHGGSTGSLHGDPVLGAGEPCCRVE